MALQGSVKVAIGELANHGSQWCIRSEGRKLMNRHHQSRRDAHELADEGALRVVEVELYW